MPFAKQSKLGYCKVMCSSGSNICLAVLGTHRLPGTRAFQPKPSAKMLPDNAHAPLPPLPLDPNPLPYCKPAVGFGWQAQRRTTVLTSWIGNSNGPRPTSRAWPTRPCYLPCRTKRMTCSWLLKDKSALVQVGSVCGNVLKTNVKIFGWGAMRWAVVIAWFQVELRVRVTKCCSSATTSSTDSSLRYYSSSLSESMSAVSRMTPNKFDVD